MDLKSFRLVFAQGGRVRSRLISARVWGGARGIPPSVFFFLIKVISSSSLSCNFVCAGMSLPPFMWSHSSSSLSLASLLYKIFVKLISLRCDNASGPGVIVTRYYSHLFSRQPKVFITLVLLLAFFFLFSTDNNLMQPTVSHGAWLPNSTMALEINHVASLTRPQNFSLSVSVCLSFNTNKVFTYSLDGSHIHLCECHSAHVDENQAIETTCQRD